MATAIAVLCNAFDRLCGMAITTRMVTPRRRLPLPEALSERGLRVSEACRIRWTDFDRTAGALRVDDPAGVADLIAEGPARRPKPSL